jgi:hypothetical protein
VTVAEWGIAYKKIKSIVKLAHATLYALFLTHDLNT